jgi:hypothetical protein
MYIMETSKNIKTELLKAATEYITNVTSADIKKKDADRTELLLYVINDRIAPIGTKEYAEISITYPSTPPPSLILSTKSARTSYTSYIDGRLNDTENLVRMNDSAAMMTINADAFKIVELILKLINGIVVRFDANETTINDKEMNKEKNRVSWVRSDKKGATATAPKTCIKYTIQIMPVPAVGRTGRRNAGNTAITSEGSALLTDGIRHRS